MSIFLNGIGLVAPTGRGIDSLASALESGWRPPLPLAIPGAAHLPAYILPPDVFADKSLGRKVRRSDRLSKMAVFAAADALTDAQLPATLDRRRIGLVVSTAFGSHATTFQFLDEILTYGDPGVSPTVFSHSVQNAPAAYIASTLDLQGPALTLTQVHFGFHSALLIARHWLASGRCDYVLAGGMDELGAVMNYISRSLLRTPADGKLRPFDFAKHPAAIPGEGSAFFLLSASPQPAPYARLGQITTTSRTHPIAPPTLHILEADGSLPDESAYSAPAAATAPLAAYSPLFGTMPGGTPLHAAAAALMLKRQVCFASPVADATTLPVCSETTQKPLASILLTRLHCNGALGQIELLTPA